MNPNKVGGIETQYNLDPYPWLGDTQMGGWLQSQSFSLRSEYSKPHTVLSSQGILHWKGEPLQVSSLALEGKKDLFWGEWEGCRIQSPTLKGMDKISMLKSQIRDYNLNGAWVKPTGWPWTASWGYGSQLEHPMWYKHW